MKEKLKIFKSKKKIFSSVSYSRALIGQDSDSCETLRSRQIFAPSLHPTYFLILSAPTIFKTLLQVPFLHAFCFCEKAKKAHHEFQNKYAPNRCVRNRAKN